MTLHGHDDNLVADIGTLKCCYIPSQHKIKLIAPDGTIRKQEEVGRDFTIGEFEKKVEEYKQLIEPTIVQADGHKP